MNQAYSVTEINQYVKNLFERDSVLYRVYVKGEVSNCKYHTSGHIYFTLKDAQGQLSCVMFAGQRRGLAFRLEEGQSVVVLGSITVYERDGKYQMYANQIVLDGLGALYERFEQLKKDLHREGLFDPAHKKPIPPFVKRVGIVTASTGAAIQDIINISRRRNPYVQLILYPALVQGIGAAGSVAKGIEALDQLGLDVLIVGRGGGSMEDLWAFNEEIVARAIYQAKTPIISAVGHETDVTIADYVADLRAPTPSAAAELAVNEHLVLMGMLSEYENQLKKLLMVRITEKRAKLNEYKIKLDYSSPAYQIKQKRQLLIDLEQKMNDRMERKVKERRHQLELYITKLEGLSPLSKLSKGYAFVADSTGTAVNSIEKIAEEDVLTISFTDGEVEAKVMSKKEKKRLGE